MVNRLLDAFFNRIREFQMLGLEHNRGEKNLFVSGYPISGNSWIAYLLAYILNCKYHDIDHVEWSPQRTSLKESLSGTNDHDGSQIFDRVLKTHGCASAINLGPNDRLVYNVRDGRDVANSFYHRVEKVWANSNNWKRRLLYKVSRIIPIRFRYSMLIGYFSRLWAKEVQVHLDAGFLIIRYEDMLVDPLETLKTAFAELDPDAWDESVAQKAIDLFSFGKMKKAAAESSATVKTDRVGGSGDWQNYFSPSDKKRFDTNCGDVMCALGYD